MTPPSTPIRIFIAYAREDEALLTQLRVFLRPLEHRKDIEMWYDGEILPGETWEQSIRDNLHAADIILLLVSADAISSNYFWEKEKADALARHHKGECQVVPIILRPCGWKLTDLAHLQALPKDGKAITTWSNQDEALQSVLERLDELVKKIQDRCRKIAQDEIEKQDNKRQFAEQLKEADVLYDQKQYSEALTKYQNLLNWYDKTEIGYTDTQPHLVRRIQECKDEQQFADLKQQAHQLRQKGKYAAALTAARKTLQIKPNDQELENLQLELEVLIQQNSKSNQQWMQRTAKGIGGLLLLLFFMKIVAPFVYDFVVSITTPSHSPYPPIIAKIDSQMVKVEGGAFEMGSTDGSIEEKPTHEVILNDFYISRYEVTQAQWQTIMGNNPSHFSDCPQCPVENVSWDDIQVFLQKLNKHTNQSYHLPTEAQWEYAARGGNKSKGYKYAGSNDVDIVAWYSDNSGQRTHQVGQKEPNELGLYDMSGNVWEWCSDWYSEDYYKNSPVNNPTGSNNGTDRILRGGGWSNSAEGCRITYRDHDIPTNRNRINGFRLTVR
ncbi:MAG: SUMF1/EgtB/PvdO family nonheme iron enzyme [Chitinophagales bacterium]|nr:SUMF1/EgtB/PvdO family nonheme iron enzyme [Chitinophagales bacterium]